MTNSHKPVFKLILESLKDESAEVKAMFFSDSEEELSEAYEEGVVACKEHKTLAANPYEKPLDSDIEKYTKYLCWAEGFCTQYMA